MTDRELLEAAAKAAGMGFLVWTPGASPIVSGEHRVGGRACWNPLEDDGDALRLAVKLRMMIEVDAYHASANDALNSCGRNPYAAMRLAIVRAAAAIGAAK